MMSMLLALGLSSACSNSDEEFSDEGFNVSDGTVIAIGDSGFPEVHVFAKNRLESERLGRVKS